MTTKNKVTVAAFEAGIFELEGIRVIIRAPSSKKISQIQYTEGFINRCAKTHTLATLRKRIASFIDADIEFEILTGDGEIANGNFKIGNLRDTYDKAA